ncbi:NAD-dependent protein deacetylase [Granulosicoccaceae sp. 1_MG-2023]|nr:NAD-dependent protein deacetylase [Granulosicoccaceae sp. 1_MG-2023]
MNSACADDQHAETAHRLMRFFSEYGPLTVLGGAGISTDSGIPDYRDRNGNWKTAQPVQGPDFIRHRHVQQRYWARSLIGWQRFGHASPNRAHHALAALEQNGFIHHLITQNVDGLHQRAGSRAVTDLHGRLDRVICLACGQRSARDALQHKLAAANPAFLSYDAGSAPDGDALIEDAPFEEFTLIACDRCGGTLKPDVVFFGENVPAARVARAMQALSESAALLVVGSSLMVYSGLRFVRKAVAEGKPVAALTLGTTRADAELSLKLDAPCGPVLAQTAAELTGASRADLAV